MEVQTSAGARLTEQRERQSRYLRYIDEEPNVSGWNLHHSSPWSGEFLESLSTRPAHPGDVEALVRDLADKELAESDMRGPLDAFTDGRVAAAGAACLQEVGYDFHAVGPLRAVINDGAVDLRSRGDKDRFYRIARAIALIRFAEWLMQPAADAS